MRRLFLLALILLSFFSTATAQYNKYPKSKNQNLLNYINQYRAAYGLPKVVYDDGLEEAARLQVLDNYIKKKFKKRGDDVNKLHQNARFPRIRDRVSAVGVATAGENCAEICYAKAGMNNQPLNRAISPFKSLEQLMFTQYQRSPGHNAIILTPQYTRVGIHTIYDGKYVYNTVVFMTGNARINKKTQRLIASN
ncbi:CAP domain-containing protein [Adhaeribacter aquaticus]|uniref:CAP domain-containing protein n=1 Tax=Adhaeribacter aquaticus TaxID=299567 RepID=UPI0003FA9795|nr:CAP domain-containing protein [Adhaeribacter aquaticus]